jgi:methyl-accepting chemotaxis protein
MKKISSKIIIAIVLCSSILTLSVGLISMYRSSQLLKNGAKSDLLLQAKVSSSSLNQTALMVENAVNNMSTAISATSDTSKMHDEKYIEQYQTTIEHIIKKFGEDTSGAEGAYFYINPEFTGGVYGAWYAEDKDNNFVKQPLGTMSDFNNKSDPGMDFYYDAVKAGKAIWFEPYVDPDLNISIITYSKPVYINNKLLGVAAMDIKFDNFRNVVNNVKIYSSGYAFLLDKNFNFLANKSTNNSGNLAKIDNGKLKSLTGIISKNASGTTEYVLSGKKMIMGYYTTSNGNIFAVCAPEIETYAGMNKTIEDIAYVIILGIIVSILLAWYIGSRISKPVVKVTELIDKTSKLNLSYGKENESLLISKDETGIMANSVINMRNTLRGFVKNTSNEVLSTSKIISAAMKDTISSVDNVSKAVEELAKGATAQAQQAENDLSKLLELADKIKDTLNYSDDVKNYSAEMQKANMEGQSTMNIMKGKFIENEKVANTTAEKIDELSGKSKAINRIVETIGSITEQINLLSLNAAIEAARAGDAGKGFTVVADEIRKLAEGAKSSTDEISSIVKEIQTGIKNVKGSVDTSQEVVKSAGDAMDKALNSFNGIDNFIDKISKEIEGLTDKIRKINDDKDEVVNSIQEISAITQQSAASTEEVSASIEEETRAIEGITDTSVKLENIAKRLDNLVKKFTI